MNTEFWFVITDTLSTYNLEQSAKFILTLKMTIAQVVETSVDCQQQQSYSGLRSPGRSNSTYFWNDSWVKTFHSFTFTWTTEGTTCQLLRFNLNACDSHKFLKRNLNFNFYQKLKRTPFTDRSTTKERTLVCWNCLYNQKTKNLSIQFLSCHRKF